jgi:hypothetical protein
MLMNKHDEINQLLAVYDDLDVTERVQVDAHLVTCADCAARLAAYRKMDSRLHQLPRLQPDPTFRQNFYTKMESNMTSYTRRKQVRRLPAYAVQLLVVGVIILLGVSFWASNRPVETAVSAPTAIPTRQPTDVPQTTTRFNIGAITLPAQTYGPGDVLPVQVLWNQLQTEGNEAIALHLLNESGQLMAQTDMVLGTSSQMPASITYTLTLPHDLENGRYTLHLMVYDQASSARLPIEFRGQAAETVIVPQAIYLGMEPPAPVLETAVIQLESWSPDSQYLILREYSEAEYQNGDAGIQRMYDVAAGQFCPHALNVRPEPIDDWFTWIDDHTFAYLSANNQLIVREACDISMTSSYQTAGAVSAILGQGHDLHTLLLQTDAGIMLMSPRRGAETPVQIPGNETAANISFSPDDRWLAFTNNQGTLWLIDTNDGGVVLSGNFPNPIWLSNDELLVRTQPTDATNATDTPQPTPFIVNLDGDITQLTTLFTTAIDETTQHILAAPDIERGSYTLLLYTDPQLGEPAPVRVYHSATGEVETLPYSDIWADGLTENGRYLLMVEKSSINGEPGYEFLVRETTAVGDDFEFFMALNSSPGQEVTAGQHLLISTLPKGVLIDASSYPVIKQARQWEDALGLQNRRDILWSPNTENVAVVVDIEGAKNSKLFILPSE